MRSSSYPQPASYPLRKNESGAPDLGGVVLYATLIYEARQTDTRHHHLYPTIVVVQLRCPFKNIRAVTTSLSNKSTSSRSHVPIIRPLDVISALDSTLRIEILAFVCVKRTVLLQYWLASKQQRAHLKHTQTAYIRFIPNNTTNSRHVPYCRFRHVAASDR